MPLLEDQAAIFTTSSLFSDTTPDELKRRGYATSSCPATTWLHHVGFTTGLRSSCTRTSLRGTIALSRRHHVDIRTAGTAYIEKEGNGSTKLHECSWSIQRSVCVCSAILAPKGSIIGMELSRVAPLKRAPSRDHHDPAVQMHRAALYSQISARVRVPGEDRPRGVQEVSALDTK